MSKQGEGPLQICTSETTTDFLEKHGRRTYSFPELFPLFEGPGRTHTTRSQTRGPWHNASGSACMNAASTSSSYKGDNKILKLLRFWTQLFDLYTLTSQMHGSSFHNQYLASSSSDFSTIFKLITAVKKKLNTFSYGRDHWQWCSQDPHSSNRTQQRHLLNLQAQRTFALWYMTWQTMQPTRMLPAAERWAFQQWTISKCTDRSHSSQMFPRICFCLQWKCGTGYPHDTNELATSDLVAALTEEYTTTSSWTSSLKHLTWQGRSAAQEGHTWCAGRPCNSSSCCSSFFRKAMGWKFGALLQHRRGVRRCSNAVAVATCAGELHMPNLHFDNGGSGRCRARLTRAANHRWVGSQGRLRLLGKLRDLGRNWEFFGS